jgi:hypothetical protein
LVGADRRRGTTTPDLFITNEAAGTGVGGRDKHESGWIDHGSAGSGDAHNPLLQRLSQGLEHPGLEFSQLIKEEDPVSRPAYLTG